MRPSRPRTLSGGHTRPVIGASQPASLLQLAMPSIAFQFPGALSPSPNELCSQSVGLLVNVGQQSPSNAPCSWGH